ncbi:hypothetical protein FHS19_001418 [Paenibacillus rhizosphaerae]|uniref:Uncharacterized protein n=1 Tax=Paenibacillus rhizosphaerae TaxID=297318 RepID=A0A839TJ53_9BACL|nr:hypothetical protein [Paenibacillus rhizosphaerae]
MQVTIAQMLVQTVQYPLLIGTPRIAKLDMVRKNLGLIPYGSPPLFIYFCSSYPSLRAKTCQGFGEWIFCKIIHDLSQ